MKWNVNIYCTVIWNVTDLRRKTKVCVNKVNSEIDEDSNVDEYKSKTKWTGTVCS